MQETGTGQDEVVPNVARMFISYGQQSPQSSARDTIGRPTDGPFEKINGWLARWLCTSLPLPACPSLCVCLLVRPISSLARLCDWNKNEAYTNPQPAKRARTFRPIYPLALFVCACPFAVVLLPVLIFIHSFYTLCALSFVSISASLWASCSSLCLSIMLGLYCYTIIWIPP